MRRSISLARSSLAFLLIASSVAQAQTETKEHTYDPLGRLTVTKVSGGQSNNDTRTVCYDATGNRTEFKTRQDGTVPTCSPPPPNSPPVAQGGASSGPPMQQFSQQTPSSVTMTFSNYSSGF